MIVDYIAGVAGGVAVVLVGHPFDTTKTRLQTAPHGFYTNTMDCVKKTFHREGFKGFYSGINSPLAGQMIFRATSFGTYSQITTHLSNYNGGNQLSALQLLMAGGTTGLIISFVEAPIDLIKTKLQIQVFQQKLQPSLVPRYTTVSACIQSTIRHHGISALWQGLSGTMMRNIPANALFFPVNELSKRYLASRRGVDPKNLSLWDRLASGAVAGLSYWVGTYPLDVIKARMQSVDFDQRMNWVQTARTVVSGKNGVLELSRGLLPCAMRSIPACASMFATVDFVRDMFSS